MTGSDAATWRYSTWGGRNATVVAHSVEFTPTHVVWRDREGSVVLAERPENVNELAQVGTLGSATRGVRPRVTPPPEQGEDVCWCDGPDCGHTPCVEALGSTLVLIPPEEG